MLHHEHNAYYTLKGCREEHVGVGGPSEGPGQRQLGENGADDEDIRMEMGLEEAV